MLNGSLEKEHLKGCIRMNDTVGQELRFLRNLLDTIEAKKEVERADRIREFKDKGRGLERQKAFDGNYRVLLGYTLEKMRKVREGKTMSVDKKKLKDYIKSLPRDSEKYKLSIKILNTVKREGKSLVYVGENRGRPEGAHSWETYREVGKELSKLGYSIEVHYTDYNQFSDKVTLQEAKQKEKLYTIQSIMLDEWTLTLGLNSINGSYIEIIDDDSDRIFPITAN